MALLQIFVSQVMSHLDSLVFNNRWADIAAFTIMGELIHDDFLYPPLNFHETWRNCTPLKSLPPWWICLKLGDTFTKWNGGQRRTQTNTMALEIALLRETQLETKAGEYLQTHHWNLTAMQRKWYYEQVCLQIVRTRLHLRRKKQEITTDYL